MGFDLSKSKVFLITYIADKYGSPLLFNSSWIVFGTIPSRLPREFMHESCITDKVTEITVNVPGFLNLAEELTSVTVFQYWVGTNFN